MSKHSKQPRQAPHPAPDPRVVAVFQPVGNGAAPEGFLGIIARKTPAGIDVQDSREFAASDAGPGTGAAEWAAEHLAARCIVALPSGSVIVRAVQMPQAPDDKLASALDLNATTFVLGRTPMHRVATAMLQGSHGPDRLRTGLVAEWPEDHAAPLLPAGLTEGDTTTFSPDVGGLASLTAVCSEPLVAIDAEQGAVTIVAPTTKGVLVRIVRAPLEDGGIDISEIARAVGEACVHAGVPTPEINLAIEHAREAAHAALSGGFGCTPKGLAELNRAVRVPDGADAATWWRTYGVATGVAFAALGPCIALTGLASQNAAARPDRAAALLNRLTEPRIRARVLAAAMLLIVFGPLAFQGARLLVLRWKLPDIEAYERAEQLDDQRRALYRILARQSASMVKTLSDIAANAPQGVEIDFVGISPSIKGQNITLRGRAMPVGAKSGTDALLQMEDLMRTSGMFEGISRNSEPPNQAGAQEFSIAAVATRATDIARYPAERDPAVTSWRVIRYGPPPADTDWVAEGLPDPGVAAGTPDGGPQAPALASNADERAAETGTSTPVVPATPTARAPTGDTAAPDADTAAPEAGSAAAATGAATAPGDTARSARPAPGSTGSGGLARRGSALGGSSNEPEPPPAALTEAEINAMTKAEAQLRLHAVANARNRPDLDEEVQARLRKEFGLLLERCKRD